MMERPRKIWRPKKEQKSIVNITSTMMSLIMNLMMSILGKDSMLGFSFVEVRET
jgi:hypothetical protein